MNKYFTSVYLFTIVFISCFFLFYSIKIEREFTNPLKKLLGKSSDIINDVDTLQIIEINKAAFNLRHTNPQKTIILADSALLLAQQGNFNGGIGEAFRVKGIGYFYLNDHEKAIHNYLEALNKFISIKDLKKQARVFNNIGRLYSVHDYNKSLEYYAKSLKISHQLGDEELTSGLYFNIASIFQAKSNFKQALYYYNLSNKLFESRKDTITMMINYLFTGTVYYQLKDYKEAEWRVKKAIDGSLTKKLYPTLIDSYTCLSKIYLEQSRFEEAEKTIQEGFKYLKINENIRFSNDLYHAAFQLEMKRKNHENALNYLIKIHKQDSSLLSKNQSESIVKSTKNHIQEQKIKENEQIIISLKYKESFFWWTINIIFLLVLFTILIGIGTYFVFQKVKNRKELQVENRITHLEQKTLQGMMNPHFIFNVLNTIQYFIYQNNANEANKILTLFARLMRKHLEICLKSSITLAEEIGYLSLYLAIEKIRFSEKMDYEIIIQKSIDPEKIIIPTMLIQPFIENAIWHGIIPKENMGKVTLNFTLNKNILKIKIVDDGIGISNSLNANKSKGHISRGLELIQERVKLLNKLSDKKISIRKIRTGKSGTVIMITIPI